MTIQLLRTANDDDELKLDIVNRSPHMNSNSGLRGSLRRLFKDKSTSSSSIKNVGKENGDPSNFKYGSSSAANTPVLGHRSINFASNRSSMQNSNNKNNNFYYNEPDVDMLRSRRTSQPIPDTNNKLSRQSQRPKERSSSRGDSFIKRLSFRFKSGSKSSLSSPQTDAMDIGLPPHHSKRVPATTKRLYYNSITQTYENNPSNGQPIVASSFHSYDTAQPQLYHHQHEHQHSDQTSNEVQLDIETMQKVFNIFDSDLDGSITIEDVQNVMNSLQFLQNELEMPSLDQIKIAFDKFDENKNGSIEFNEFLNILKSSAAQNTLNNSLHSSKAQSPANMVSNTNNINSNANTNSNSINLVVENGYLVTESLPQHQSYQYQHTQRQQMLSNDQHHNNKISVLSSQQQEPAMGKASMGDMLNDQAKENMRIIFEQFDKDNDGRITKNELNFVMCNLFPEETITEQDINEMFDAADLDRNNFIDFNEFANMFKLFSNNAHHEIARIESQQQLLLNSSHSNLVQKKLTDLNLNESTGSRRNSRRSGQLKKTESSFYKSTKSLAKSLSRSNSKEGGSSSVGGKRSRTTSQSHHQSASQSVTASPSNYRKFFKIFTTSQMMDLKAAFTMFDKNGDQKISESELLQVMRYLGLNTTEKEVRAMIEVVDKNRNGFVDYDEFIQMMTNTSPKPLNAEEELLKKTFQIFDMDGNGYISADEIKQTMANLGENLTDAEVNDMIKAADKNGDGRIDMNEFSGLINGVGGPLQFNK